MLVEKITSHNNTTSTSRTPFRAVPIATPAFTGLFVVDEILGFDRHVYDVRGPAEGEFAICVGDGLEVSFLEWERDGYLRGSSEK